MIFKIYLSIHLSIYLSIYQYTFILACIQTFFILFFSINFVFHLMFSMVSYYLSLISHPVLFNSNGRPCCFYKVSLYTSLFPFFNSYSILIFIFIFFFKITSSKKYHKDEGKLIITPYYIFMFEHNQLYLSRF